MAALVERARAAGIPVHDASEASLRRLSKTEPPAEVLGPRGPGPGRLAGAGPRRARRRLAAGRHGLPGQHGLRDPHGGGLGRRRGLRRQRLRPRGDAARRRARRCAPTASCRCSGSPPRRSSASRARRDAAILALEDVGDAAPWEVDLTGPLLLVVGGERHGIPEAVLRRRGPGAAHSDARLHPVLQPAGRDGRASPWSGSASSARAPRLARRAASAAPGYSLIISAR